MQHLGLIKPLNVLYHEDQETQQTTSGIKCKTRFGCLPGKAVKYGNWRRLRDPLLRQTHVLTGKLLVGHSTNPAFLEECQKEKPIVVNKSHETFFWKFPTLQHTRRRRHSVQIRLKLLFMDYIQAISLSQKWPSCSYMEKYKVPSGILHYFSSITQNNSSCWVCFQAAGHR